MQPSNSKRRKYTPKYIKISCNTVCFGNIVGFFFLVAVVMYKLTNGRLGHPWTTMFADDIVICERSGMERRGMKVSQRKTEYVREGQEPKWTSEATGTRGEEAEDLRYRVKRGEEEGGSMLGLVEECFGPLARAVLHVFDPETEAEAELEVAETRYTDTVREGVKLAREEEEEEKARDGGRRSILLTLGVGVNTEWFTQTRCV